MMKFLIIVLITISFDSFGQSVQIDTFYLPENQKFEDLQYDKMQFPVVNSGNANIDSLINHSIKNQFTKNEFPHEPIDSTLLKWAGERIIYLDFEVTYNQNGILSLNITAEGCGAYCTRWTDFFNYSTNTGKSLDISNVVDTTGGFRGLVYKDKRKQYREEKRQLKAKLKDSLSGIDQTTYKKALKYYEKCENTFDLESFAIYPGHLEIIEQCYLPHVIKNLTPNLSLKYKNTEIKEYLKIPN